MMFISIFIGCPLTWDRWKEIRKKYRTPRIVDTALNIGESNDIFLFLFIRKFLLQPKDNYIFF